MLYQFKNETVTSLLTLQGRFNRFVQRNPKLKLAAVLLPDERFNTQLNKKVGENAPVGFSFNNLYLQLQVWRGMPQNIGDAFGATELDEKQRLHPDRVFAISGPWSEIMELVEDLLDGVETRTWNSPDGVNMWAMN